MKFNNFQQYLSIPRVGRYLAACSNDRRRCVKLYKSNLKVAQSFHPILGIFEVVIRNAINEELATFFADPDWIINQKTGFMVDPILTYTKRTGKVVSNRFLLHSVRDAENKLIRKGIIVTSGRIISEQSFSFWTELYENYHYKILKGRPIKIFKNLPSNFGRNQVLAELTKIRKFRNRVNHNEPICFSGGHIDFSNTIGVYNSIRNILSWIDPTLLHLVKGLDKIHLTIAKAQAI